LKPKNRLVLVVSDLTGNPEIYLMNWDGTEANDGTAHLNLTRSKAENGAPAWSPDGHKIAFHSNRHGAMNIYVMDADGGGVRQLTKGNLASWLPSWSGDGKKIAFARQKGNTSWICLMSADGTGVKELREGYDPALSPDGMKILFVKRTDNGFRIALVDVDGANVKELTTVDNPMGYCFPAWSHDGKKIAWTDMVKGGLEIFAADADGRNARQLTPLGADAKLAWPGIIGAYNYLAAWSPDSRHIAFFNSGVRNSARPDSKPGLLCIISADGSNPCILLRNIAKDGNCRPAWRPR
jgi:TolB protein